MTPLPEPRRLRNAFACEACSGPPQMLHRYRKNRRTVGARTKNIVVTTAAFGAIAVAAAVVAAMPLSAAAGSVSPDDAKRLTRLVRQDCGSCHGLTLKGGLGKPLTADALDHWDREQIAAIILNGVPGTPMPPWRPLLSESEAQWIAGKLKTGELQ